MVMEFFASVVGVISEFIANIPAEQALIFDIAFILIISAVLAFIARIFRQPLIPAYVIAGLIIGPLVLGLVQNTEVIKTFSEMGIAFLLFAAGLEISFKKIKEVGIGKIILIGFFQVAVVFFLTLLFREILALSLIQAIYIGIILAFGSTMVVIKLLDDKEELVTMHGRLVLGILLLQDLIAILAIVVFMSGDGFSLSPILIAMTGLVGILAFAFLLQRFVLNRLFRFAATSTEMLLLSALGVLFLFIVLTFAMKLSIVIGAFIAGVSLANSPFKLELESRITPLRDFFAILFFVALGMQIIFSGISWTLFIFLLGGAWIVKPIVTFFLLRVGGYRPKTSFMSAVSLAQLSEFSLIIGMLGLGLGVLTSGIFSTIVLSTIITMGLTTYIIDYKSILYRIFKRPLSLFKFLPMHEKLEYGLLSEKTILLVGCHRMGSILMKNLWKKKDKILVIDYNPEIINALIEKKISCIYGEIGSPEILEKVDLSKVKLVLSTVPNAEDNRFLLRTVREKNPKAKVVLTASRIDDALDLYDLGADYVILPKVLAGEDLLKMLHKGDLSRERGRHIKELKKIHRILY